MSRASLVRRLSSSKQTASTVFSLKRHWVLDHWNDRNSMIDFSIFCEGEKTPALILPENSLDLAYGGQRSEHMADQRMRALFDDIEVNDRYETSRRVYRESTSVKGMVWERYRPSTSGPFEIQPSNFLSKARELRPEYPEATASGFASWVYSLYGRPGNDEDALKRGIEAEKLIFELLGSRDHVGSREVWTLANGKALQRRGDGWKLVHQGIHLNSDTVPFFELEGLQVRGQPLRASPDLVFRNQITGQVLVVEIKLSRQSLPSNLWPNIWAQLWCYSQIPIAKNAPQVTVTGEVWGENTWRGSRRHAAAHLLYLRAVVRRDPRAPSYDLFFRQLFEIYCGH